MLVGVKLGDDGLALGRGPADLVLALPGAEREVGGGLLLPLGLALVRVGGVVEARDEEAVARVGPLRDPPARGLGRVGRLVEDALFHQPSSSVEGGTPKRSPCVCSSGGAGAMMGAAVLPMR